MKKIVILMCIFLCIFNAINFGIETNEITNQNNLEIEKTSEADALNNENIVKIIENDTESKLVNEEKNYENEVIPITHETYEFKNLKGEIIEAGEVYESNDGMNTKCQDVKVYIDDEGYKATALITYRMSFYEDTENFAKPFEVGDKVYIYTTFENGRIIGTEIAYRNNTSYLILMVILFVLAVILVGRGKGIKSLVSLIITILLIFYVLIPSIMDGKNPIGITVVVSIATVAISFIIISGLNKKSYSAMIRNSKWNNNFRIVCNIIWQSNELKWNE